jgi:hypothetical protein
LDDLDLLIDDVAKTMTSAPAREGLAMRVAARVVNQGEGDRGSWFRPWVMAPIAAAVAVVVAVFVAREGSVRVKPDATKTIAAAAAPVVEPVVERPFQGRGRVAGVRIDRDAVPVALPTVEPIEVDRLDIQPLVEMNAIQIAPIAIDRIDISAMP